MAGNKTHFACIATGILLAVTGGALIPVIWNAVKHSLMTKLMVLEPSSLVYNIWEKPPFIIYWRFHFFDVVNSDEVLTGAKASLVQKGPYVYRLEMHRQNLTRNSNSTISNKPVYSYFFERGMSVGPESDSFMSVNVPFATIAHLLDSLPIEVREILSPILKYGLSERLFRKLTVKELLWGYQDELLKIVSEFVTIPGMPNGEFGFLVGQNGSAHDEFTVFTGEDVRSKINLIERWNGNNKLSWWHTPYANMINGTDGVMFHSFVTEEDTLHLFQPNLCRQKLLSQPSKDLHLHLHSNSLPRCLDSGVKSMPFVFDREKSVRGVPLTSFYLPPTVYQNSSVFPSNAGFCNATTEACGPSGQMRVDKCRFGVPTSISNPHFLYGDESLINGVYGLDPDPAIHKNYFSVQPILGVTFELKFRLQLNLFLDKVAGIRDMKSITPVYFPMVWFEQSFEANDWMVNTYSSNVGLPTLICQIAQYCLLAIGVIIAVLSTVAIIRVRSKPSHERQPLLSPDHHINHSGEGESI